MRKLFAILVVAIFIISLTATAMAADMPAKSAKKGTYPAGPIQKLERGVGNAAFGWTEIPKRVVDKTKESNPIKGVILGVFQGTCKAFARTASGLSEVVTFPLGKYDKPKVLPDMPAAK